MIHFTGLIDQALQNTFDNPSPVASSDTGDFKCGSGCKGSGGGCR
ncbi:MAG: hypothetical protein QM786_16330 [Breznakibacter sp.]